MSEETIFQQLEICQKQLGERWKDIAALKETVESQSDQLAALREELSDVLANNRTLNKQMYALQEQILAFEEEVDISDKEIEGLQSALEESGQRLADAERRNALPIDCQDQLFAEMERRFDPRKQIDDDHMVYDDTKIGVEFARDWIAAALNPKPEAASHE